MIEDLLSQTSAHSVQFLELCNALYERELRNLANQPSQRPEQLQSRLKSLPYYIKRTAGSMLKTQTPLLLDLQNASWSMKQAHTPPIKEQSADLSASWYEQNPVAPGLIVPVLYKKDQLQRIIIDCVDRTDIDNKRFRTNFCGWFAYEHQTINQSIKHSPEFTLLKPNKKVFLSACCGHQWHGQTRTIPFTLSLRELLLSCQINWPNFKKPIPAK